MTPEQIEKSFGHEMKQMIIATYVADAQISSSDMAREFNQRIGVTGRQAYPVWKKLEQMLFDEGEIPFIRNPVGSHKIVLAEGVHP